MKEGDRVRVKKDDKSFEGFLIPSPENDRLVIKLENGYNIGFKKEDSKIDVIEKTEKKVDIKSEKRELFFDDDLPTISIVSTGGTIASSVDYRTGAVTANFNAEEIIKEIPELKGLANYRSKVVSKKLSENMDPEDWQKLAKVVYEEIKSGSDGIVITHGTDTMQYTASALSFMIDTPVPIVFTGSQRSADRPSSDNVVNAVCSVETAKSDIAEVLVCMHSNKSDLKCSIHRATRVRKNHTSRRDAFETIGGDPLANIDYNSREININKEFEEKGKKDPSLKEGLNKNVSLVKFFPGSNPNILDSYSADGIIIEGTGLGHVSHDWVDRIKNGEELFVITSQCIEGRICDRVYDTGRDLLKAGAIEGEDMVPETALVKVMWVLENKNNPREAIKQNLANEITK